MHELISIIVPMYYEEEVAEECYLRLSSILKSSDLNYELIFVNDGSKDRTLEILEGIAAKDKRVKVISFSRNFGHQVAVTAGIDMAMGDALVVIDADLQDPPELIPQMIELWKKGYHVVYARRKRRDGEGWFKLLSAKTFYRVLSKMTNVAIPLDTGDFRLIDKKVAEVFKRMPEKNRFVRGMISWLGFKQIPIEYHRNERFAGKTKYPLKKMLKFALDGIFSFSMKPIKFIEYAGIISLFVSLAALIYSGFASIIGKEAFFWGGSTIVFIICFFGGIQLLSMGILGEYISRIYDESRVRPLYIIEKEINTFQETKAEKNLLEDQFKEGKLKII